MEGHRAVYDNGGRGYIGLGLEASIVVAVLRCASAEVPCPGKQGKPCEQKSSVVKFQMVPLSLWCVNIVIQKVEDECS